MSASFKLPPLPLRDGAGDPTQEIAAFIASGASGWAVFDDPLRPSFRHILGRRVADGDGVAVWGMLNPSKAGAYKNDPTVTRVIGFTRRFGKAIALVVNVSDYIATDSSALLAAAAPRSPRWEAYITAATRRSDLFICGWGANGYDIPNRVTEFLRVVRACRAGSLHCLRVTKKTRQPEHPLMLPATLTPMVFNV